MQVNNRFGISDDGTCLNSKLIDAARENGAKLVAYMSLAK